MSSVAGSRRASREIYGDRIRNKSSAGAHRLDDFPTTVCSSSCIPACPPCHQDHQGPLLDGSLARQDHSVYLDLQVRPAHRGHLVRDAHAVFLDHLVHLLEA